MFLRILGSGFQFLVLFALTNNAHEELVGKYSFLNSMVILLGSLSLLGMNSSFLQFTGKYEAEQKEHLISQLIKKKYSLLSASFLIILIGYLFLSRVLKIDYFDQDNIAVFDLVIMTILPFAFTILNIEILRGFKFLYLSELFRNIFRYGVLLIVVILLVLLNKVQYILDAYVALFLSLFLFSTAIIIKTIRSKTFLDINKQEKLKFKDIVRVSFPMSFSFISLLIMQSCDVFLLEQYYSFAIVAYYGVAIKISTIISIILSSINATIAPKISKLFFENNMIQLGNVIKKATLLNFILSLPIIIVLILFSDYILSFFGDSYVVVSSALYIILIGQTFNALCGPVGLYFNMTGKQNYFQRIVFLALIINIILNIILIPKFEMIGAAISTAFSFVLWNVVGVVYIYKKDKLNLSIFNIFFKN